MYKIIICLLLLAADTNALKISKGGGNRGSSAARMNSNAYHPQQSAHYPQHGNHHSQQSGHHQPAFIGSHPQQSVQYPQHGNHHSQQSGHHQPAFIGSHPSGVGGYHQQGGFAPNQMKPSSKGTIGKAFVGGALGAAAGLATFELGKAILRSNSEPLRTPNGQNYYFDERNHQPKNGYFMCSMLIDDVVKTFQGNSTKPVIDESTNSTVMTPEQFFKTVQFNDGSRPKSLTWNCKINTETCCDTDCCPAQLLGQQQDVGRDGVAHHEKSSWLIFVSVLILLIPLCC